MIDFLLKIKVNVNEVDEEKCSALYYALVSMNKSIIRMLMKTDGRVIAPID